MRTPSASSLSRESEIRSVVPVDGGESSSQLLQQGLSMTCQRTSWFNRQNSLAGTSRGVGFTLSLIKPRQSEPGLRIPWCQGDGLFQMLLRLCDIVSGPRDARPKVSVGVGVARGQFDSLGQNFLGFNRLVRPGQYNAKVYQPVRARRP